MAYLSNNSALYPEWLANRIATQGASVAAAVLGIESANTATSDPTNSALFTSYQQKVLQQAASLNNQTTNNAFTFLGLNLLNFTPTIRFNDDVTGRLTIINLNVVATATG